MYTSQYTLSLRECQSLDKHHEIAYTIQHGSMVESVDTPDLKSVGHYARGSSSLPTPTWVV